ncbi:NAD(P) transhydrogenase subunit alpha [Horticoccus luteus]|uniref:proton-translocating NAD(P)(+) transhydrogenase n=1 Tax=Horticoccus luteus TaxID=2862869 RepID=A0A8F9TUF3_9BACT|nr:NAD(P) transhydrogenase subunit alpha [Horticoccus luteus]QYM79469.1 NAD(P) transhydrogenase subunit alpha [Horticoccus luteus]
MICYVPAENAGRETRAALTPATAQALGKLGLELHAQAGLGRASNYPDADYTAAGVTLTNNDAAELAAADIVLRVRKPSLDEIRRMKRGALHVSFLDPFNEPDLIAAFAAAGISAVSLEMIPRTTLAQKMDALSSQASLAGYAAVIEAAQRLKMALPMMMTPAGTIMPARVFVIGAGVAGLQAIATAKRLGARIDAFDTRPVVEEQVRSLGAKFVKIDLGQTGQTAGGYAQALTPEQIAKQQAGMAKICAQSDIVITTAKLFGRKAPRVVTQAMLDGMKPGSVVVDLAVESGGNVEGSRSGEDVVTANGVTIIGNPNLEGTVAYHATQVLAANFAAWLTHFWDDKAKTLHLDPADEILKGCLITQGGAIVHPQFGAKA